MQIVQETTEEFTKSLNPVMKKFVHWRDDFITMFPNIVVAFVVLILFVLLARLVRRLFDRYLDRMVVNKSATGIISYLSYFVVLTFGCVLALSILELESTVNKILAGAGILGVALGFAFQDTAANFISGTYMAFRSNFKVGDYIETNDIKAVVQQIDLRSTKLKTLDGYLVVIANKEIFQKTLINYNAYPTRRITLECGVGYESDLEEVERETLDVLKSIAEIKTTPSPQLFFTEFGDSSINYELRFWVDFLSLKDYFDAKHQVIKAIKKRYDEKGISIPFPIRTLDFSKADLEGKKV